MKENHVADLVDPPEGANVIGTRWVLSKKFDADGKLVKYKARLVAQGFTQREGVDYHSTYAPVIAAPSLRLMLSITANKGYAVDALDISTVFLNGRGSKMFWVSPPKVRRTEELSPSGYFLQVRRTDQLSPPRKKQVCRTDHFCFEGSFVRAQSKTEKF